MNFIFGENDNQFVSELIEASNLLMSETNVSHRVGLIHLFKDIYAVLPF
jgi:hypothetical protein